MKAEECEAMLARRKLCLVLDLDHTLLNSATYAELSPEDHAALGCGAVENVAWVRASTPRGWRLAAPQRAKRACPAAQRLK